MNNTKIKIYDIGKKIGIDKKEIEKIWENSLLISEQSNIENGPRGYLSTLYGSLSIKDF